MLKRYSIILLALLTSVMVACGGCKGPTPTPEPDPIVDPDPTPEEPADLSLIKQSVPVTDDWVWSGKPQVTIHIENPNKTKVRVGIKVKFTTDKKKDVETVTDSVDVAGEGAVDYVVTTTDNLEPGFYRAVCQVNGKTAGNFIFGIDPFKIVSASDKQPDYDQFWQTAKDQLADVDMNANLTEIESKSTDKRKVYLVEMYSVPDGLSGEPVVVRGYYCEPQDGQKHPVVMHFYGYDTQGSKAKCECPSGSGSANAEFYLSHRGQYLNNRPAGTNPGVTEDQINPYGDWFSYNFGDKNSWYYRGAFMDCIQAVRFMATRETSDMTKLFAEGSSQGGALTYACAALSDYPFSAIACNVAFLGDFADAMSIGGLAAEISKRCKGSMTDAEMLAFLSYFDTKNLATRISCPVLASSGLQDNVCPPRTNVVPFNNLRTPEADKQYIFGPKMGHDYPGSWYSKMNALFKSKM
ncbi:MAG: acetylxylan esterase [Paludibacteraceae bacterium]|nr:acetylxylan esterase [Paludibacteraceae bacterium]